MVKILYQSKHYHKSLFQQELQENEIFTNNLFRDTSYLLLNKKILNSASGFGYNYYSVLVILNKP